jgi:trigger factor
MSTVETLSPLQRRIKLSVDLGAIQTQVQSKLRGIAKTAKLPGFRPGKVPLRMIEASYGAQAQAEVLGDAVSDAFTKSVEEHKLRVAGQPTIERDEAASQAPDQTSTNLSFVATFEVFPEITLGDLTALNVEKADTPVGDAEIEKTIDILRKQRATFADVDRATQDGDRVTIDFKGMLDDVAFEGGSAEDFPFTLGEGRMLADFETGVRGKKAGEQTIFPVAFPADYGSANLAGKTAQFTVTIKKVEEPVLPVVDTEFAKQLGIAEGDVAKMRSDVKANLEREVSQRLRGRNKASVMEALPGLASFELPAALIGQEQEALVERAKEDLKARGVDVAKVPVPADAFKEQAEKRVRLGLIVAELVKANNLQAKPDQIRKQIEEFAQSYENPAEVIRHYFSDRNRLAEVEAMVVEQNVVDLVHEKAKVNTVALAFDTLMQGNN